MLERVTLGQTRFSMPGVSTDSRGIALGKLGIIAFAAIDGVVRWLRLYADEDTLDDLLPSTKILRAQTPLRSRACLLVVPAASSYVLDRAARLARLAGGQTFTGTSKHFARYRDDRSPYGYDVPDLSASASAEFVLHDDDGSQTYTREGEIDPAGLIMRLSLLKVPGGERLDAEGRSQLFLTVAAGLARGLMRYLLRNHARAEVAAFDLERRSVFAAPGEGEGALLARVRDVPERVLASLRGVPGVSWFRPVADNVAVELGYRHPVALTAVATLFQRDRFYLFRGAADRLDVVRGAPVFSAAEHLGELRLMGGAAQPAPLVGEAPELGVELRLTPTTTATRRVVGTLVGWDEAARLKKLVYALPPVLLAGHRIAASERGVLILGNEGVDVIPLGTLLTEIAPGVLVPAGMDLTPRVPQDVLHAALEGQLGGRDDGGRVTVFVHDGPPFYVTERELAPLERRALARIPVEPAGVVSDVYEAPPPAEAGHIVNDSVGRFSLWGFQAGPPNRK